MSHVRAADRRWWSRQPLVGPFDALWTPSLFRLAHERLGESRARGVDRLGTASFAAGTLDRLCAESWDWRPEALRWGRIGDRDVGVPTVDDQLVVTAWRMIAEPRLDARLPRHVWGYRPGRSTRAAVSSLTRAEGRTLVRLDIRRMFESLDHGQLAGAIERAWPGSGIGAEVVWRGIRAWSPGAGVPTGVAWSPALSNAAMALVDDVIEAMLGREVQAAVRYADDFALLCAGGGGEVIARMREACLRIGLVLHPAKTRVAELKDASAWPIRVLGVDLVPRADGRGILVAPQTSPTREKRGFFR